MSAPVQVKLQVIGDERVVLVDRDALIRASKYFEVFFSGRFAEGRMGAPLELDLETLNIPFETFRDIVRFDYSGISKTTLKSFMLAADYFQMDGLVPIIAAIIEADTEQRVVDSESALDVWMMSQTEWKSFNTKCFSSAIETFIATHFLDEIIHEPAFRTLDSGTLVDILKWDNLKLNSEKKIFNALKLWIEHNREERLPLYGKLIYCMRYDPSVDVPYLNCEILELSAEAHLFVTEFEEMLRKDPYFGTTIINQNDRTGQKRKIIEEDDFEVSDYFDLSDLELEGENDIDDFDPDLEDLREVYEEEHEAADSLDDICNVYEEELEAADPYDDICNVYEELEAADPYDDICNVYEEELEAADPYDDICSGYENEFEAAYDWELEREDHL